MKKFIVLLILSLPVVNVFAQDDIVQPANHENYLLVRNFISLQKSNPDIFSNSIKPQWNSKLYQEQYQQLLAISKKKEFYPVIILDSRFVSQAIPTRYGSQNYMWVSTQPEYKNLGEQIANEVVSDVVGGVVGGLLSGKKHRYTIVDNKKGYYTPVGLKF